MNSEIKENLRGTEIPYDFQLFVSVLTLTMLISTVSDDILIFFFVIFFQKK